MLDRMAELFEVAPSRLVADCGLIDVTGNRQSRS
jgi:hypothetical protein